MNAPSSLKRPMYVYVSLRFAEDLWGLGHLAAADKRANSPALDCFDFSQKPRPFVKTKALKGPDFFLHQYGGYFAPDYE
jgi:hypothetical protein